MSSVGKRNSTTRSWTKIPGKHLSTGIKENEKRTEKFPSFQTVDKVLGFLPGIFLY